jgi:hypothetical protein
MKPKSTLTLDKEFLDYCELNNISDLNGLAQKTFNRGFTILKYGETPNSNVVKEIVEVPVEVIKEVIIEKIKEVPVEVIREVRVEVPIEIIKEVIKEVQVEVVKEIQLEGKTKTKTKTVVKEVPVEVIKEAVKEVIVEKIVEVTKEVTDTKEVERLTIENEKLKKDLEQITNSLGKFTKGRFMKDSNMSNLYDE